MDGCFQFWTVGCVIDWGAWGAIFTAVASASALWFGLGDMRERRRRDGLLAGVLASGIQLRLGALIKGMEMLQDELEGVVAGIDPAPSQLQRFTGMARENAERIGRGEIIELAPVAPRLAGYLIAALEGCWSVHRLLEHTAQTRSGPGLEAERQRVIGTAAAVSETAIVQAHEAFELVRGTAAHQLTKLKPMSARRRHA